MKSTPILCISIQQIRNYRTSAKANLTVKQELNEIIIGSMLGDLSAERKTLKNNTRLQFKQSIINKKYVEHLYCLFKDYCGTEPRVISRFDNRPNKMKEYSAINFKTLSLPCFNVYRSMFYNTAGVKVIPKNIGELLTVRGLAY